MEAILFSRTGKKAKSSKSLKELTSIVTPNQFIAKDKRQALIDKIQLASALQSSRFETLGMALVHNLINHCQNLPETLNSYYALPGGVMDYALNRTEAAMQLFREMVVVEDELSEEQKLWGYALLTAGLLKGIGKLQIDYHVDLYDLNGQNVKLWNPLLESMSSIGSYYHYEILSNQDDELRKRLNLLLARLLMPASGFSWIASNPDVLSVWLALIDEDWESAGTLGALLVRADAIAIQRYISQFMASSNIGRGAGRISTFVDTTPENLSEREILTGVEFIKWLTQALEKGEIMVNKSPLFMVPGGMLMSADLFKLFVREHPEFKNWQVVQNGFLALGMHAVNAQGAVTSRFEQSNTQQIVSGVVFEDYAVVLPEQVKFHHLNTGKVATLSAVELVNVSQQGSYFTQQAQGAGIQSLQQLNAQGKWIQASADSQGLTFGGRFGG